jgi:uncharacterized membrane protein YkvA (DUF1232 family)
MHNRLTRLLRDLYVLYLTSRDSRTGRGATLVALAALAWVVFPGDFDFVPLVGWIDDAVVVTVAKCAIDGLAPDAVVRDHEAASATGLRRFLAGVAVVAILLALALGYVAWRVL